LLPGILRAQELRGGASAPGLQVVAADARAALTLAKYLPLLGPEHEDSSSSASSSAACLAAAGAACLGAARGSPYWSTRAAAHVLLAVVWFRHQAALPSVPSAGSSSSASIPSSSSSLDDALRAAVAVHGLRDPQAEVRAVAGGTLSGMLRGRRGEGRARLLRAELVRRAGEVWRAGAGGSSGGGGGGSGGGGGGRPPAGSSDPQQLLQQQALVQGLKALLLASPYEVPPWSGRVLAALASGASSRRAPAAVRREASAALAEFRRTHDADECREVLGEAQWEAVVAVSAQSSSYFA